jgi:cytochrome c oxidase subunit 3
VKFFEEIRQKPWEAEQAVIDDKHDGTAYMLAKPKLGLRVLLTTITVIMSLIVIAYSDRMFFSDWHPLPKPWLLWLNTGILILSSIAMQRGVNAARELRVGDVKTNLLAAGVCAFAFLFGQLWVWQQLVDLGYFAAADPANAFFYLLTAVHGVHLLGGLVAWGRVVKRLGRDQTPNMVMLRESMEMCATYWHYLLIVWAVFFLLMLFS